MDAVWLETLAIEGLSVSADLAGGRVAGQSRLRADHCLDLTGAGAPPGCSSAREGALVAGCLSLVLVFAATLPFNAARLALAIQLQPARIFWMLDFLAVVYVVWAAAEGRRRAGAAARARHGGAGDCRPVARSAARTSCSWSSPIAAWRRSTLDDDDWARAMAWARGSPAGSGWLADPGHAVALRHERARRRASAMCSWRRSRMERSGCTTGRWR